MGIISGASQHPKDVPFVLEFWWGTYGLFIISPQKIQILAKAALDYCGAGETQCHCFSICKMAPLL